MMIYSVNDDNRPFVPLVNEVKSLRAGGNDDGEMRRDCPLPERTKIQLRPAKAPGNVYDKSLMK